MKDDVLAGAEKALEAFVEQSYEAIAEELVLKIKELVPGDKFDGIVDLIAVPMKPAIKELLLAQIEKISTKV